MSDFDLSQALPSPDESDEPGCESRCFNMTDVQDELFRLDEGLDMVVSHDPITMESVAVLVVAVNKMKRPLTSGGRRLSGSELCSVIMDSVVEETIIEKMGISSRALKAIYHRSSSWEKGTLCDQRKKDIVQTTEQLKLQAVTLTGGNGERRVEFKLSMYDGPTPPVPARAVVLSIVNGNYHISCSMESGTAKLNLEECSDEDLKSINDAETMGRFLFFRRDRGLCETTFESVMCPGWYISTFEDENLDVEMCKVDAGRQFTNFSITMAETV